MAVVGHIFLFPFGFKKFSVYFNLILFLNLFFFIFKLIVFFIKKQRTQEFYNGSSGPPYTKNAIYWLQCSNNINNLQEIHTREKRMRPNRFASIWYLSMVCSTTYQSPSLHMAFLSDCNPWICIYICIETCIHKAKIFLPSHHVCNRTPYTLRLVPSHHALWGGQRYYKKGNTLTKEQLNLYQLYDQKIININA